MSVSQDVVFIGNNTRVGTLASDPIALWESDGTTATEVQPFVDSTTTVEGARTLAYSSLDGASLPGSLLFDLEVSTSLGSNQFYVTDPATGTPLPLNVPNLPTTGYYAPSGATSVGQVVLFAAATQPGGTRVLWRSDGTAGGTSVVSVPGASAGGLKPQSITAFDGGALFVGSGADNPGDVFFTDGTTAGTREIAALLPVYGNGTQFAPLGAVGGREVFSGPGPQEDQPGLYATDGTAAGTVALSALSQGSNLSSSATVGNRLLYTVVSGSAPGLYATDGTATGASEILASDNAGDLTSLGAKVVFTLSTPTARNALWVSDGTTAGTTAIAIANLPQPQQVFASELTQLGSQVLFSGVDTVANGGTDTSYGLWITDGTAAGTREIAPGVNPTDIVALPDGQAYFAGGAGSELYVTDGTAAGTHLVPGTAALNPNSIIALPSPLAFTGTQAQYDLAPTAAGALQTRDLSAPGSAPLALPDARVLTFADGSTAVFDPSGNAEAIARIYLAAYGQAPDLAGLLSYTQAANSGTVSLARIAAAAPVSAQFLATYGTLSDAQFVTRLYENADGRAPDPGGLTAYTQALASGQTRGQVLLAIAESPEARIHSQSVAGDANDATVARLYEAIDARAPDPSGLAAYGSALDAGQSVAQIAAAMLASPEYARRFEMPGGEFQIGMPPDNTVFVAELYQNLLGRAPDPGGLASYTADLAAGESRAQLVAGFVASDEARLVTAPLTHQGYVSLG